MQRISRNLVLYPGLISMCLIPAVVNARVDAGGAGVRAAASAFTSKAQTTNVAANNAIDAAAAANTNAASTTGAAAIIVDPCAPPTLKDGWYMGATLGYGTYKIQTVISNPLSSGLSGTMFNADSNWSGGILLGLGKNFSRIFYLGGEIFIVANNLQQTLTYASSINTYSNTVSNGPTYGLGILPGIKLTAETLTYIRLGWNWVTLKTEESIVGAPFTNSVSKLLNGFVFGFGMETLISTNYSVRAEYDHMYLGTYNTLGGYNTTVRPSNNEFFLTFIYHA